MESRWASVGGTELHWVERGAGRPTVFLHGLADSHLSFVPLAEAFPGRRLLLLDLPGHGLSGRPDADYTPEWYGEVLAAWWDELGLEDVDLVGHSYGGAIAQLALLTHAERTSSLTLIAPGGLGPEVSPAIRLLNLPFAEHVVAPFLGIGTRLTLSSLPGRPVAPDRCALAGWYASRPGSARALTRTARSVIDFAGQHRLVQDRVHEAPRLPPAALLWGTADPIIPYRQVTTARSWIEQLELRSYPGVGHWPHLERTRDVARDVTELWGVVARPPIRIAFHRIPRRPSWPRRAWRWTSRTVRRLLGLERSESKIRYAPAPS